MLKIPKLSLKTIAGIRRKHTSGICSEPCSNTVYNINSIYPAAISRIVCPAFLYPTLEDCLDHLNWCPQLHDKYELEKNTKIK